MKTLKNIMMIALAAIVSISLFSCSPDPVTEKKESMWVMDPSLAGQKNELWTEPAYDGDTGAKLGYIEFTEDNIYAYQQLTEDATKTSLFAPYEGFKEFFQAFEKNANETGSGYVQISSDQWGLGCRLITYNESIDIYEFLISPTIMEMKTPYTTYIIKPIAE